MPWKEELPMDQKPQFVSEYLCGSLSGGFGGHWGLQSEILG